MTCKIEMNRRFLRSVNLHQDRKVKDGLTGYVITPSVRNALARLQNAFTEDITERAFTLTGPYGTGKSSFGLFLWHLLSDKNDSAWKMLREADPELEKTFKAAVWRKKGGKGFLVLTLTARRAPIAELLAEAFEGVDFDLPKEIMENVNVLRASRDTKKSMSLIRDCMKRLEKMGYAGVFFIFDELGKVFEEARSGKADVFLLQELAEAVSRSGQFPILFLGMMHQSFADYAEVESTLRNEFSKIEGRFEPISFIEPVAAQINLAAAAFPERNPFSRNPFVDKIVKGPIAQVKLAALVGLNEKEFTTYAKRAQPLHPLTLAALPYLFRRFGQNERSIFSFLTSNESKGFREFIRQAEDGVMFRLCDLYDYFFENYEAQLAGRTFGQPFMEAHAAIQAKASLSAKEVEVLKTVAVLTSLGLQSPIHANEALVRAALSPVELGDELSQLRSSSVLVYRKFNKTYALWNGSDIDLHECCKDADDELSKEHFSVAETFTKFLPPTPVVAKRHTIAKGSLRYFDTVYVDDPREISNLRKNPKSNAAGTLVVCLTALPKYRTWFASEAKEHFTNDKSFVFAIPSEISDLTDALLEIRRLNWVEANVKELRDDRIARRELAVRLAAATQAVTQHQYGILDPRSAKEGGGGCKYICGGVDCPMRRTRDVSVLLSDICDELYSQAPVVKNELVNKNCPSSQAAAARRVIINAINDPLAVAKERLGIEGFPPERSIYESVIARSRIHVPTQNGYELVAPPRNAPTHMLPVWKKIEELVFAPRKEPLVIKDLYDELARPPYGVLAGMLPIIVAAFYAVNKDEVSLYSEGTFLPDPQNAHFELMVRRPELFAISGMHITGTRAEIIHRLAGGLQTDAKVLPVVRKLYAIMNSLSKYAKETNAIGERTQRFRQAFFDAKSPERLLFVALPQALGLDEIGGGKIDKGLYDEFFEGLNSSIHELASALPNLIDDSRKYLLKVCGFDSSPEGWQSLYDKASFLLARIGGSDICPFLQNVVNTAGDWNKADQVMSYIQKTPMANWGTTHINEFHKNAFGIGERFKVESSRFSGVGESLSTEEMQSAKDLQALIRKTYGKRSTAVLRVALLACLDDLNRYIGE